GSGGAGRGGGGERGWPEPLPFTPQGRVPPAARRGEIPPRGHPPPPRVCRLQSQAPGGGRAPPAAATFTPISREIGMRTVRTTALVVCSLVAVGGFAPADDSLRAIIQKAVKAPGGAGKPSEHKPCIPPKAN